MSGIGCPPLHCNNLTRIVVTPTARRRGDLDLDGKSALIKVTHREAVSPAGLATPGCFQVVGLCANGLNQSLKPSTKNKIVENIFFKKLLQSWIIDKTNTAAGILINRETVSQHNSTMVRLVDVITVK